MALYETGIVQVNSAIGTGNSLIWNPENTSPTTFGSLGSVPATAVLKDVTIINNGTVAVLMGSGTVSGLTLGLSIPPGGQVTLQGYSVSAPSGTVGQIWGSVATGTGSTVAGLATNPSVT